MRGRPTVRPARALTADEVTEEHRAYTIIKMFNMREFDMRWERLTPSDLTHYVKIYNVVGKNETLRQLVDAGYLSKTEETTQRARRIEKTTYYELTEEAVNDYCS